MEKVNLEIGDKALLFKLDSFNAGIIDLEELIGTQKIALIFSRYFGCPICQLNLRELLKHCSKIESTGAKILYITQSGEEVAKQVIEENKITFPVIPSSKEELYKEYGLRMMGRNAVSQIPDKIKAIRKAGIEHGEYEGWEKQSPGQFVIDTEGKIIHEQKGWLDIDSLLKVL